MNRSVLPDTKRRIRADQRLVRKALSIRVLRCRQESVGISALAGVEAEHLLVNVGVKVEGARSDIRPVKRPFQARPKVFDSVGMDASLAVGHEMVNKAVRIVGQPTVGEQSVGIDRRARKNVGSDMGHKLRPLAPVNDHCLDAALAASPALGHAEHQRLAFGRPVLHLAETEARHHRRLLLSAHEGFVGFDFSVKHSVVGRGHRFADTVKHKPGGFLRHAEGSSKFMRRGAVLGVGEEPRSPGTTW